MSNVAKNLRSVKEKISNAYLRRAVEFPNREPRLVAVSKTKPIESIIEAYECGQRHFGENYVQEIVEKSFDEELLKVCPDIKWHFLGHLQKNKVNKLLSVPNLYIIETVDNAKLAQALDDRLRNFEEYSQQKLNVFIQVNTSGEEAKSGCNPNEIVELVKFAVENCKNLSVKGLMTIGKYDNYNALGVNSDFQTLIECRSRVCRNLGLDLNEFELSMGMSGDFEHAVEMGATNVRVGSLIFGERPAKSVERKVLIDGTICAAALKHKINIQEQIPKYLEGEAKLLTTPCILNEVEQLGSATFGALLIIKQFGVHQCGHSKLPAQASECILHMIGEKNASRYIIATQDRELQQRCRNIRGVPLLYLHSRTPVLEAPSTSSQEAAGEKSRDSWSMNELEKKKLSQLGEEKEVEDRVMRKRKRKGEPNPLSCKKKKKKLEQLMKPKKSDPSKAKKKRKRNRSRLMKKIKSEMTAR